QYLEDDFSKRDFYLAKRGKCDCKAKGWKGKTGYWFFFHCSKKGYEFCGNAVAGSCCYDNHNAAKYHDLLWDPCGIGKRGVLEAKYQSFSSIPYHRKPEYYIGKVQPDHRLPIVSVVPKFYLLQRDGIASLGIPAEEKETSQPNHVHGISARGNGACVPEDALS
ncbi:hypothetical protein QZH41_014654, partial [Actinostola sp. cb2023]